MSAGTFAEDLKKDEAALNEIFQTKHACASIVWNKVTKQLVKLEPCWPTDHDGGWLGNGKAKGIIVSKQGRQTCFKPGKSITFVEDWQGPGGHKNDRTMWQLSVKKPTSFCYTESGK